MLDGYFTPLPVRRTPSAAVRLLFDLTRPLWHHRPSMPERPSALSRGLSLPGPRQDVMLPTLSRHTSVYEITPTLPAVLWIAPSRDLRGEVLAEAFTPDAHQKLNIERIDRELELPPPRSPTPATLDRELLEKLCSLGYTNRNGGRLRRVIEAIVCAESRP